MEKTRKSSNVPVLRQEKLADLFLPNFKHDQKLFICILSLNIPEMRLLGTLSQFYQVVTMKTMTVTKSRLRFCYMFLSFVTPWP